MTRQEILSLAVGIASVEGLGGLTIGRLADEAQMSKSGVFAHFGSKEDLQVAAVEAARAIAVTEILRPGLAAGTGLAKAWALVDRWLSSIEKGVFPGGCFFAAASLEFDDQPGPVRDRIEAVMHDWAGSLEAAFDEARKAKEIGSGPDSRQLAFEANSLVMGANWAYRLHRDGEAFARARRAFLDRLRGIATDLAPSLPATP